MANLIYHVVNSNIYTGKKNCITKLIIFGTNKNPCVNLKLLTRIRGQIWLFWSIKVEQFTRIVTNFTIIAAIFYPYRRGTFSHLQHTNNENWMKNLANLSETTSSAVSLLKINIQKWA